MGNGLSHRTQITQSINTVPIQIAVDEASIFTGIHFSGCWSVGHLFVVQSEVFAKVNGLATWGLVAWIAMRSFACDGTYFHFAGQFAGQ